MDAVQHTYDEKRIWKFTIASYVLGNWGHCHLACVAIPKKSHVVDFTQPDFYGGLTLLFAPVEIVFVLDPKNTKKKKSNFCRFPFDRECWFINLFIHQSFHSSIFSFINLFTIINPRAFRGGFFTFSSCVQFLHLVLRPAPRAYK